MRGKLSLLQFSVGCGIGNELEGSLMGGKAVWALTNVTSQHVVGDQTDHVVTLEGEKGAIPSTSRGER